MLKVTFAHLESMLGLDFISYCTVVSKEDLSARFRGERTLPTASEAALGELISICTEVLRHVERQQATNPQTIVDPTWGIFGVLVADQNMSLANVIRAKAGGEIFRPDDADPLVGPLQQIVVNVFPILLIPPADRLPTARVSLTSALISYPASSLTVDAIMADDDLKRLYPWYAPQGEQGADGLSKRSGDLMIYNTIEAIVIYTFNKVILTSFELPSAKEVCQEIRNSVTTAKNLIQGKRVSLPAAVGLSNLRLPPRTVIESKIGRLSEYSYIYDRWSPAPLRSKRVNQTSDQGQHDLSFSGLALGRQR